MSNNNNEIPAVITTAHLLLRGLIPAFVGCSIGANEIIGGKEDGMMVKGDVQASAFQMMYRKDLPKLGPNGEAVSSIVCVCVCVVIVFVCLFFCFCSCFWKERDNNMLFVVDGMLWSQNDTFLPRTLVVHGICFSFVCVFYSEGGGGGL